MSKQDAALKKRNKAWRSSYLTKDGDPIASKTFKNTEKFGFTCPLLEYVESPDRPTIKDLAKKWMVPFGLLAKWCHDQKWDEQRERFWSRVEGQRQSLLATNLAETRAKELSERKDLYSSLREQLKETLRKGYIEDPCPTGGTIRRDIGPKDIKDIMASLKLIDEGIDKAIGVTNALGKMGNSGEELEQSKPVRRVRHNFVVTVEEDLPEERPALPEPNNMREDLAILDDIVEGIVVEKNNDKDSTTH